MLFIQFEDLSIRTITFDYVAMMKPRTEELITKEWIKVLKKGEDPNRWSQQKIHATFQIIRANILSSLQDKRELYNEKNGYSILDGSEEAIHFLEIGKIPLHYVKKILLLSDGLLLPQQSKNKAEGNWLHTANFAFENGLSNLLDKVSNLEKGDPACYVYPRAKYSDDKTGVLVTL